MTIRIIPKIEIKNKNLIKGICFEGLRIVGEPLKKIEQYVDDLADEIFIIDVVASLYGREIDYEFIKKICFGTSIPITVSGGIKDLSIVEKIFMNGASKVSLNSAIFSDYKIIEKIAKIYGEQAVVINIEVRKINNLYKVFYNYGREFSNINLDEWLKIVQDNGAGEILLTSIDNDGLQNGFDFYLIENFYKEINVPLIISGGFNNVDDIIKVSKIGEFDFAIASSFHLNHTNIVNLKEKLQENNLYVRF